MEKKIVLFFLYDFILLGILFLINSIFLIVNQYETLLYIYKNYLIFLFIYCLFSLKILKIKFYEPIFLFLFLFFLFLLSKVFLEIVFDFGTFSKINYFISYEVSVETAVRALLNLSLSLIAIHLGVLYVIYLLKAKNTLELNFNFSKTYYKVGLIMIILSYFPLLMYYKEISSFVETMGYLSYQSGENAPKSIFIFLSEQFFWLGVAFFLSALPSKKQFIYFSIILILPLIYFMMMTGKRGLAAASLLMFLWYWQDIYKIKINKLFIVIGIAFGSLMLVYIGFLRHGTDVSFGIDSLGSLLLLFVDNQGSSVNTLLYSIQFMNHPGLVDYSFNNLFADVLTLFDKFYRRLFDLYELSLIDKMKEFGYSGYLITYNASPNLLYEGASTGTSFVAELFLLGQEYMQMIGSFFLGAFIMLLSHYKKRRIYLLIVLVILPEVIYLPRMSFASVIVYNFLALSIVLILYFLISISNKRWELS